MRERRAVVSYRGGEKFVARTGTSREIVFGDAAELNEQSPVEIIAAALGACTGMDVAAIMAKKRQVVDAYTITVEAVQRDEYPQVLTRIELLHDIAGPDVSERDVRRCIELSATKYCPVNAMLSAGATEVHHRYRVRGTGETPFEASGEVLVTGPFRRPEPVETSQTR
jgi:putative redox protein